MQIENRINSKEFAPSTSDSLRKHRLQQAAEKFEAMLLNEIVKPLTSKESFGSDDSSSSAGADVMTSYGSEALSDALARSGTLGLSKRIVDHLA